MPTPPTAPLRLYRLAVCGHSHRVERPDDPSAAVARAHHLAMPRSPVGLNA